MVLSGAGSIYNNNSDDDNTSIFSKLTTAVKGFFSTASNKVKNVGISISDTASSAVDTVVEKVSNVKTKVVDTASSAVDSVKNGLSLVPNLIKFGVVGLVAFSIIKVVS